MQCLIRQPLLIWRRVWILSNIAASFVLSEIAVITVFIRLSENFAQLQPQHKDAKLSFIRHYSDAYCSFEW